MGLWGIGWGKEIERERENSLLIMSLMLMDQCSTGNPLNLN